MFYVYTVRKYKNLSFTLFKVINNTVHLLPGFSTDVYLGFLDTDNGIYIFFFYFKVLESLHNTIFLFQSGLSTECNVLIKRIDHVLETQR